uniref:Ribosomal protein S7 n=1 Tax=Bigelowiella natans TaxID=227086 RepID=E9NZY7_BIGNA|nr:ribosomal protein S7 [Bigelowiella natans]
MYYEARTRPSPQNTHDPLYKSWFFRKIIGGLPLKSRSRNKALFRRALARLRHEHHSLDTPFALVWSIHKIRPLFWIRTVKKGKREYKIPFKLTPRGQYRRALYWVVKSFRGRTEPRLETRLFLELKDLLDGKSKVFSWRDTLYNEVGRNRHNANFRW